MKVLFDTNVILDVLIERKPYYKYSVACLAKVEKEEIEGWICSTTVTTIAYLLGKELSGQKAAKHIESLLTLFNISTVNKQVLFDALHSGFEDYEDSVLHQSALTSNLDSIISRNKKDFKLSELSVYTPKEYITILNQLN
ncbi:MAG: PIN domain-containing protein [Balneolaceae bacterium]|nr:PIN domain-containing protein [Balneolaceae bacterium]